MRTTLLAIVLGVCTLPVQERPEETIVLHWGWPAEGSVRVHEESLKKGHTSEISYQLVWRPEESGEGTVVEYRDWRFHSIDGIEADDPRIKPLLAQTRALVNLLPRMHVDAHGNLRAFSGLDEIVEWTVNNTSTADETRREAMRRLLAAPEIRQAIEASAAQTWNVWVASWIDVELRLGMEEVWEYDVGLTGGSAHEMRVTVGERTRHRGVECVEIATLADADEELAREQLLAFVRRAAAAAGADAPDSLPLARVTRREETRGLYTVADLRPLEVERSSVNRLWQQADGEPVEQLERHHYRFEWPDLEPEPAAQATDER